MKPRCNRNHCTTCVYRAISYHLNSDGLKVTAREELRFDVITPSRKWHFRGNNQYDKEEWMKIISQKAKKAIAIRGVHITKDKNNIRPSVNIPISISASGKPT